MYKEEIVDYGLFINTQMLDCFDSNGAACSAQSAGWLHQVSGWVCDLSSAACMRRINVGHRRAREDAWRQEYVRVFKQKLKSNLANTRRWRLAHKPYPYARRILRESGKLFTRAFADDDIPTSQLVVALNKLKSLLPASAERIYERLDNSELEECSDCGYYTYASGAYYTINESCICESCIGDYVYSDAQGGYIYSDNAVSIYTSARAYRNESPDDYVTREYGDNDDSLYSYQRVFVDADTYSDLTYDEEENEDEDEDEAAPCNLAGYHQTSRFFTEINETPRIPALGVELEVYCSDRYDAVETLKGSFGSKLILEQDGSLDDDCGFEIVTQPYGVTEWKVFAPDLLSVLRDNDCLGYNEPAGRGYGIHVNVHRRHLSPLAEARIMMLLCDAKNIDFVHAIAQRTCVYAARVDMGSLENPKIRAINGNSSYLNGTYRTTQSNITGRTNERHCRKISGAGKYAPVNWKDNVAEFRLFQSTLHTQSFMKNLEFVWALIAWTKPEAATGSSTDHRDFIRWLDTPQHRADYPNLVAYLSRRRFWAIGRDGTCSFNSTWLDLIAYPNTLAETEERLAA